MPKKILVIGLIATIYIKPVLSKPSLIQVEPSQECSRAISFVIEEIKKNGGEDAALYRYTNDANDGYYGNPTNRNGELRIALGGTNDKSSDIMNSSVLLTNWANKIVESCLDVAVVSFGIWHSSWLEDFAIQEDGKVKIRECIESEIGRELDKLSWNMTFCEI